MLGVDLIDPSILSQNVTPTQGASGTSFNISTDVIDNQIVNSVTLQLSAPNSTITNYSMSAVTGDTFTYLYTGTIGGDYNFTIFAEDGSNTNESGVNTFFNVTSSISTSQTYYARGDTVTITGTGTKTTWYDRTVRD